MRNVKYIWLTLHAFEGGECYCASGAIQSVVTTAGVNVILIKCELIADKYDVILFHPQSLLMLNTPEKKRMNRLISNSLRRQLRALSNITYNCISMGFYFVKVDADVPIKAAFVMHLNLEILQDWSPIGLESTCSRIYTFWTTSEEHLVSISPVTLKREASHMELASFTQRSDRFPWKIGFSEFFKWKPPSFASRPM